MAALFWGTCSVHNLVVNGSFEEYTECPNYFGLIANVVGWSGAYNSPDYFNACAGGLICGVPFNQFGFQWPAHGDGYVGLYTYAYNDFDYREIITSELEEPLQADVPVYISFKASSGGYGSIFQNSAKWKARGPGLKFFVDLPINWSSYI